MDARGRIQVGLALTMSLALLSGCAEARPFAKVVAEVGGDVGRVAETKWVPKSVPPQVWLAVPPAEVDAEAQRLSRLVADLDQDDAVDVVKTACDMADLIKASGSSSSAASYLRDKGKSGWVYAQRAKDLAAELADARSNTTRAKTLGGAAVCEAANQLAK